MNCRVNNCDLMLSILYVDYDESEHKFDKEATTSPNNAWEDLGFPSFKWPSSQEVPEEPWIMIWQLSNPTWLTMIRRNLQEIAMSTGRAIWRL